MLPFESEKGSTLTCRHGVGGACQGRGKGCERAGDTGTVLGQALWEDIGGGTDNTEEGWESTGGAIADTGNGDAVGGSGGVVDTGGRNASHLR